MRVILVRHAESISNKTDIRQGPSGGLSDVGKMQSKVLAKRLKAHRFDKFISSSHKRALETAYPIAKALKLPIIESPLFVERRNPSCLIGRKTDEPEVVKIEEMIYENFHDPNWRHSDEENFFDQKKRASEALKFLESSGARDILVMTHGMFLRLIAAYVIEGESLEPKSFLNFNKSISSKNTGICIIEHSKEAGQILKAGWRILTWNDHTHLI